VQKALKNQIINVFEPIYLDVLNDDMVGFANISARDMLDHLFTTFGNITAVDLEDNFEHMRRERGSTLGVVKARSNIFDDGSNIKD
jgi:hypothetical protein